MLLILFLNPFINYYKDLCSPAFPAYPAFPTLCPLLILWLRQRQGVRRRGEGKYDGIALNKLISTKP